jgi:glycine/serine hydroxymethyltransferase
MKQQDFRSVGLFIGRALKHRQDRHVLASAAQELLAMARKLPLFSAEWMPVA